MVYIDESKFFADMQNAKTRKENIIAEVKSEVAKINYPQEVKEEVEAMLVEKMTAQINKEIAFYEKYIVEKEDIEQE